MIRPGSLKAVAERRAAEPQAPLWTPLCEFLDAFYEEAGDHAVMLMEEPTAMIPREEAAYLAATAEHLSLIYSLPPPAWASLPQHFLDHAYWPDPPGRASEAIYLAESPVAFRRRFIFTEGRPLRRKNGPRSPAA